MNIDPINVHLLNLPNVRWRQIKQELLLPLVPEDEILHIQVMDQSCIVSLRSRYFSELVVNELNGVNYKGMILVARTDEQLQYEMFYYPYMYLPIYKPPRIISSLRQYPYQDITDINVPDKKRLFIGNLPYSIEWKDLKDYLRNAGDIQRVEIPMESNGQSKGFAIATFNNELDSLKAIEMFNGINFNGRLLTVRFDKYPIKDKSNLNKIISKVDSLTSINDSDKNFDDEARNLIESLTK